MSDNSKEPFFLLEEDRAAFHAMESSEVISDALALIMDKNTESRDVRLAFRLALQSAFSAGRIFGAEGMADVMTEAMKKRHTS